MRGLEESEGYEVRSGLGELKEAKNWKNWRKTRVGRIGRVGEKRGLREFKEAEGLVWRIPLPSSNALDFW